MMPRGEKDPCRRHECRVWLEAGVLPASTTTRSDWKTSKLLVMRSTQMSRRCLTTKNHPVFTTSASERVRRQSSQVLKTTRSESNHSRGAVLTSLTLIRNPAQWQVRQPLSPNARRAGWQGFKSSHIGSSQPVATPQGGRGLWVPWLFDFADLLIV